MFRTRKRIAAFVGVLVLALSSLYFVGVALADTPTPTTTAQKTNYRQVFVDKLAAALGVTPATLESKVKEAEKSTIDEAVANGDLAPNAADRMKTAVDNGRAGVIGGLGMLRPKAAPPAPKLAPPAAKLAKGQLANVADKAIADKLGLTPGALKQQLRSGQSLESLASAKGLTVQDLYNAAADAVKARLDVLVKNGKLAQARADEIVQAVREGRLVGLDVLPKPPARQVAKPTPTKG